MNSRGALRVKLRSTQKRKAGLPDANLRRGARLALIAGTGGTDPCREGLIARRAGDCLTIGNYPPPAEQSFKRGRAMPMTAPYICRCGMRVAPGAVCECRLLAARTYEKRRGTARQRGYNAQWERESKAFLALPENRFCMCGCGKRADMVHHDKPHRGDMQLFWDRANWRPMAFSCHSSLTAKRDGGFGNPSADKAAASHQASLRPKDRVLL